MFNFPPERSQANEPDTQRLYVDEAGDPFLFNRKGESIVETNGCSRFFIIGKLDVSDPDGLMQKLTELRTELLADPYFVGVPSFDPKRKKTALIFHAKDDLPEVRYLVFRLLHSLGDQLRFHAVVCDKRVLLAEEMERRRQQPRYRYNPDSIYDGLMRSLLSRLHRFADRYEICVAKRGNRDRNHAIRSAIEAAEQDFEQSFGFSRSSIDDWDIIISDPKNTVCLQAVDYFLWAVQRLYESRRHPTTGEEIREDRFLKMLWPQIGEIHDLHFGGDSGTFFTAQRLLSAEERFGVSKQKKKKS